MNFLNAPRKLVREIRDRLRTMELNSAVSAARTLGVRPADVVLFDKILRGCVEPRGFTHKMLKDSGNDEGSKRFRGLLTSLNRLLPLPLEAAAVAAENYARLANDPTLFEIEPTTDVAAATHGTFVTIGENFQRRSKLPAQSRVLFHLARVLRPQNALELGTAYGFSSFFTLTALQMNGAGILHTIDCCNPQHTVASQWLGALFPKTVHCHFGRGDQVIPELKTRAPMDFIFHDAGHYKDDYINDFESFLTVARPGTVVVFDDIYWRRTEATGAHEGWLQVVSNPRVAQAAEVDEMGVLRVG